MSEYTETGEELMVQLEIAFNALSRETNLWDGSEETRILIKRLRQIVADNVEILGDLRLNFKQMNANRIQLECDREQLELELGTVSEQLKLHVRHSGTDQSMLIKMMTEIENLKEENYDLSERLTTEIENNQRRLNALNNSNTGNLNKHDIQHFMTKIEKYHCKLISLEAIIEALRRKGIKIPNFPQISRTTKGIQVDNGFKCSVQSKMITNDDINQNKQKEKINELLKEIEFLKEENEEKSDKLHDINDLTQRIKKQLAHQENKYKKLRLKNSNLKREVIQQNELLSNFGRSRVMKLALLISFCVGIVYRKPQPLITKTYL